MEKISGKQTWEYYKTNFESALRRLQIFWGNTMWGTAYYQENLLQAGTTHNILGEFNTVKKHIIEALKYRNK